MNEAKVRMLSTFSSLGNRPTQEDHQLMLQEKGIFVIADGFGGAGPGAAASRTACEAVREFLVKEAGDLEATLPFELRSYYSLAGNVLFNALIHSNRRVLALNKGKSVHERGGASVLAGYLDGSLLAVASIGACNAWLFRDGLNRELVTPRSYGRLRDPFATEIPPGYRVPLTAVGINQDLEPEIFEYHVRPGDWIVFSTDTLKEEVRSHLGAIQLRSLSPEEASSQSLRYLDSVAWSCNSTISLSII